MFKWVNNTPIFLRLLFAFAWATIIPISIIVLLTSINFQTLDTTGAAIQKSNQAIKITTTELADLQSMHTLLVALLPTITLNNKGHQASSEMTSYSIFRVLSIEKSFDVNSADYQRHYELATAQSMTDIRAILSDHGPPTIISRQHELLVAILQYQWPQYKDAQDAFLKGLYAHIPLAQAASLLQQVDALYTPLLTNWQEIVTIARQVNTETVKVGPSQLRPILFGTIIAILGSMVIVFLIGSLLNRTITQPLRQLVALTKRVMQGEITARANLSGRDEIARVSHAINQMLDTIVELMQKTRSKHDELQLQVEKLISDVRGVTVGDLRLRAEVMDTTLGTLASSSNYMINELESLVIRIKKVAREVEAATVNILEQMAQPVKIGYLQIQQVAEATTGVEQMTQISHQAAHHAQQLHAVADEAQRSVTEGHHAVRRTIDEISHIQDNVQATASKVQMLGERSEKINNIVEVISTIAYQTNRLALDSAIQAALAGENAKGFAPVAVNIRQLAEQTKNHANQITRIVRSVREDIATATHSMRNTVHETSQQAAFIQDVAEALDVIFTSVERQTQEIATINQMATQHWQSANRIAQIMPHISNTTQRNNEHIAMASQHIQRLSQQVELLRVSVGAFKVHTDQDGNTGTIFA
ncbi:MAG: HAMP domain-containing protein [Chloroflexi bacterium]|nr:MAG: HAMP domain-containing protein [Chloroflexota bacterium]